MITPNLNTNVKPLACGKETTPYDMLEFPNQSQTPKIEQVHARYAYLCHECYAQIMEGKH